MIIKRSISAWTLLKITAKHLLWLFAMTTGIALLYYYNILEFAIPWVPVSVIGTAVAFYTGFKNDQSYERLWEARKIWGGIVNESRTWGMMVDGYISNISTKQVVKEEEIKAIKKRLIYRHVAWFYAHRSQLLVATPWERKRKGEIDLNRKILGGGLLDDEFTYSNLKKYLNQGEYDRLINTVNMSTQIINEQSRDLRELRARNIIDDFRYLQLENILRAFYTLQGQNERIKKFPFPRQYANISWYFVSIFIVILPFTLIPDMISLGDWGVFWSIPITVLVSWVFIIMEMVGDYSENPFTSRSNDIPMLSISRTIEIDLLEILGDKDLPPKIEPKNGILM